jgi:hypothetical protein
MIITIREPAYLQFLFDILTLFFFRVPTTRHCLT